MSHSIKNTGPLDHLRRENLTSTQGLNPPEPPAAVPPPPPPVAFPTFNPNAQITPVTAPRISLPAPPVLPGAPGIGLAPRLPGQQQKTISGETFRDILPSIKQFESTTGRTISPEIVEGLSRAEFGEAADRAAQNRQLGLQEGQLDLSRFSEESRLSLQQFGLDSSTLLRQAGLALQTQGQSSQQAAQQFALQLQAIGMNADEAFRLAEQAINVQVQNEQFQVQREGIAAGVAVEAAGARAQGLGTIGGGLIAAGAATGNPFLIGAGVALPLLGDLFE